MTKYTCPCCGYKTFNRADSRWDICEICFWQNDTDLPFEPSGANQGMNLAQVQQNFISFGACDKPNLKNVRLPFPDEIKDDNWQPFSKKMGEILRGIAKYTFLLNEMDFTEEQKRYNWLGYAPAKDAAIEATEKRLNCSLPKDYIEFLKITNGFPQTNDVVNSTLLPVEEIDFLVYIDEDLIEIWEENDTILGEKLRSSILIGGKNEEQMVLLIPDKKGWICWQFASWIPGERAFKSFTDYLKKDLAFWKEQAKGLKKQQPKEIIDYSLRDAVFDLNWQRVYDISQRFIVENKTYPYINTIADLYALMLLASHRLNIQNEFIAFLKDIPKLIDDEKLRNDNLIQQYIQFAQNKLMFHPALNEIFGYKPLQNPKGLTEIEEMIKKNRKDLLKEKNAQSKVNYQLSFLYDFGNTEGFIQLYESQEGLAYLDSLKAAAVYASVENTAKAKFCIQVYLKMAMNFRPFEPYLNEQLLPFLEQN